MVRMTTSLVRGVNRALTYERQRAPLCQGSQSLRTRSTTATPMPGATPRLFPPTALKPPRTTTIPEAPSGIAIGGERLKKWHERCSERYDRAPLWAAASRSSSSLRRTSFASPLRSTSCRRFRWGCFSSGFRSLPCASPLGLRLRFPLTPLCFAARFFAALFLNLSLYDNTIIARGGRFDHRAPCFVALRCGALGRGRRLPQPARWRKTSL
jgi:hypothetical protein